MKHLLVNEDKWYKRVIDIIKNNKKLSIIVASAFVILCLLLALFFIKPKTISINEVTGYNDILDNIQKIEYIVGDESKFCERDKSIKKISKVLKDIELRKRTIAKKSNKEAVFFIKIDNEYNLCFSKNFKEFWITSDNKESALYKVMNTDKAKELKSILKGINPDFSIKTTNPIATKNTVFVEYAGASLQTISPTIEVKWNNNTKKTIYFKQEFKLYYNSEEIKGSGKSPDLVNFLMEGDSRDFSYYLNGYDISMPGIYKFVFSYSNNQDLSDPKTDYLEVVIGDKSISIKEEYTVSNVIFNYNPGYYLPNTEVRYGISTDNRFLLVDKGLAFYDTWHSVGNIKTLKITKKNFDDFLNHDFEWADGYNAASIRENVKSALYCLCDDDVNFYYVLNQKNGERLIVEGFYDTENNNKAVIKAIYK